MQCNTDTGNVFFFFKYGKDRRFFFFIIILLNLHKRCSGSPRTGSLRLFCSQGLFFLGIHEYYTDNGPHYFHSPFLYPKNPAPPCTNKVNLRRKNYSRPVHHFSQTRNRIFRKVLFALIRSIYTLFVHYAWGRN